MGSHSCIRVFANTMRSLITLATGKTDATSQGIAVTQPVSGCRIDHGGHSDR